jgi:uncharacterized FlgJ-related protein
MLKKLFICFCVFLCILLINTEQKANSAKSNEENTVLSIDSNLTEENIYISLMLNNIRFPQVVLSQIMIETGYLTSKLCKINNNLLGMMVPSKRETFAINNHGYAKYSDWFQCIADYKLYQDYIFARNNIQTKAQYIAFLHRNYAKSPDYKKKLIKLSNKYELRDTYNNIQLR